MSSMKRICLVVILLMAKEVIAQKSVVIAAGYPATESNTDWMIQPASFTSTITKSSDNKEIVLDNGLVRRVFRLTPNVACTDYTNKVNGQQLIRAVSPEARLT